MLPSNHQLVTEIRGLLQHLVTPSLASSSRGNDLFEAYLFALVIEAATGVGARVHFEDVEGRMTRYLTLRTSPGAIYARSPGYSHAVLHFSGVHSLEVDVGIYVAGRSTVLHECDVCVVEREEAIRCRQEGFHPRSSKVRLAVEAKFYGSQLGIALAREFAGLCSDISASHTSFVSNTTASNVARLLSHRFNVGAFHPDVLPASYAADDFCSYVRQLLRRYREQ